MHTAGLTPEMFQIQVEGVPSTFDDLFPGFDTTTDRIGVLVRTPYGGMGVSHVVARAMAEFYGRHRGVGEVYPDYFLFEVGDPVGDHSMLDIWPPHHLVSVPNAAEEILQALNDRGVTRLLVETTTAAEAALENWTRASALRRLTSALVFDPSGRTKGADVSIAASAEVEREIGLQLDPDKIVGDSEGFPEFLTYYASRRHEVSDEETSRLRLARERSIHEGVRTETYRRISPAAALDLLATRT